MKRKMLRWFHFPVAELCHCKDGCEWSWYWVNHQVSAKLHLDFHAHASEHHIYSVYFRNSTSVLSFLDPVVKLNIRVCVYF